VRIIGVAIDWVWFRFGFFIWIQPLLLLPHFYNRRAFAMDNSWSWRVLWVLLKIIM
jgi:hypothetical protein